MRQDCLATSSAMRSCGRFGPAIDGTTVDRSSSRYSEYSASWPVSCQRPCSLAYASTSATCSAGRPVSVEVLHRLGVDREDRAGGAELRAHVADGGAVGQRHRADAVAVELHELADDAVLAQDLGDREHEVGGGGAGRQFAGQLEADDARDEHRDRLAEHGRLGLDAADAPAEHAEAVLHGRVGVGADARVRVSNALVVEDDAGEVLDVDLVDDAGAGRYDLEVVEALLAPLEELVALVVAAVLELHVALEGVLAAEDVDLHRVVDDHLGGVERVDLLRVAAEVADRLAHRGQVHDAGHAGEVLHDHAGGRELDLLGRLRLGVPAGQRADVVGGDVGAVLGAQEVFQQDFQAVREACRTLDGIQPENLIGRVADAERLSAAEAVQVVSSSYALDERGSPS